MTTTGQIIRWSTAGAVVGVAAVAAVASYEHAYALVRAHGETGWIGRLVPLTVDELTASAGSRLGVPAGWYRRRPSQYRRHQPGFGPACFGAVVCSAS
jgi:hypothetical protein